MKKMILILTAMTLGACSSMTPKTEELKQSNQCMVWKDGPLGTKTIAKIEGEVGKQQQTCWIMNMWGCTYTDYTFNGATSDIKSSLPPEDKIIAKLEGSKLTNISMAGITVDPIDLKADRADYTLQALIGPKQKMSVEYNQACTKRQVAVGLLSIIAK